MHRDDRHEDHVFDAKFKVRQIAAEVEDGNEDEGRGGFKREDVYKMHAYRDALPSVRSAWVLYPGTELRFLSVIGPVAKTSVQVRDRPSGVGAVPLAPRGEADDVAELVRKIVR